MRKPKKQKMGAGVCPYCLEKYTLRYDAPKLEDNMIYFSFKCRVCGTEGRELYRLEYAYSTLPYVKSEKEAEQERSPFLWTELDKL